MRPRRAFFTAPLFLAASHGAAMTTVGALVTDAYDGDTLTVEATIWPDPTWTGSVRVLGVDTPEIRGQCDRENRWAIASHDYVRNMLVDQTVILTEIESDKYGGRVLSTVYLQDGRKRSADTT